jgi:hypothetical protein
MPFGLGTAPVRKNRNCGEMGLKTGLRTVTPLLPTVAAHPTAELNGVRVNDKV